MSLLKTGLLGGTFNPVHSGHIDLGTRVLKHFSLDRVLYMLSANPPHKQTDCRVDKDLRWEMLNRALKDYPGLEPSDVEMKRPGLSWSLETVRFLKEQSENEKFYFISGSEGFLKIRSWRRYRELLDEVVFIVVLRKTGHREEIEKLMKDIGIPVTDCKTDADAPGVLLFSYESDKIDYSSTDVRSLLADRCNTEGMVTDGVEEIIKERKLYER